MAVTDTLTEISSAAEPTELLGTPSGRAVTKERTRLERHYGPHHEELLYGQP